MVASNLYDRCIMWNAIYRSRAHAHAKERNVLVQLAIVGDCILDYTFVIRRHSDRARERMGGNNNNNNNNKREGDQKGIDTPMPSVVSDLYAADPEMLPLISNNIQLDYPSRQYRSYSRLEDPIVSQHPQQRYCTLEEVFKQFPGVPIHIDIKVMKRSLVDSTLALIEKYNRVDITIVGSGHNPASQWVKDYMDVCNIKENLKENTNGQKNISKPHNSSDKTLNANSSKKVRRYLTCGNTTDVYMIYFCYYIGILPWVPLDIDAFDIPLITTFVNEYEIESKSFFKVIKTKFLFWMLTAPNLWKLLQRRGVVVLGFVINDEKCWEEVRDWPINGVMTDDPIRLRKYIEDRDKHHPKNSNLDGDYPRW
eukprot:Tbor_TRINITY_DN5535_c3_g1::TRINITY_DN5535_c3_g1_i15::g.13678::m.13678